MNEPFDHIRFQDRPWTQPTFGIQYLPFETRQLSSAGSPFPITKGRSDDCVAAEGFPENALWNRNRAVTGWPSRGR